MKDVNVYAIYNNSEIIHTIKSAKNSLIIA